MPSTYWPTDPSGGKNDTIALNMNLDPSITSLSSWTKQLCSIFQNFTCLTSSQLTCVKYNAKRRVVGEVTALVSVSSGSGGIGAGGVAAIVIFVLIIFVIIFGALLYFFANKKPKAAGAPAPGAYEHA